MSMVLKVHIHDFVELYIHISQLVVFSCRSQCLKKLANFFNAVFVYAYTNGAVWKCKIFSPNFSFHDGYEQFAKFFACQIFLLYGTSQSWWTLYYVEILQTRNTWPTTSLVVQKSIMKILNQKVAKWSKYSAFFFRWASLKLTLSQRFLHNTAAFYAEQCTNPSLFHNVQVSHSSSNQSMKNYGIICNTIFLTCTKSI